MTDGPAIGRRDVLRQGLAGAVGLATLPSLVAACGDGGRPATPPAAITSASTPSRPPGDQLTLATWFSSGFDAVIDRFTAQTRITVRVNSVNPLEFGDTAIPYLEATPEDVVNVAAAGSRKLAARGLATRIDDVWDTLGSTFSPAVKLAATADDGHQYFMPFSAYPWAIQYRQSLFDDMGYVVPSTWADFKALAGRMQRDGLIPIAMSDVDVFEADGTFDILDLRQNGCQFHLDLLAGKEKWTDSRVADVFERWREIMPFTQTGAVGRSLSDAVGALFDKVAGMYLMGTGVSAGLSAPADLDAFPFPRLGTPWDPERALDLAVDGFMITRNSPTLTADLDNAKAFVEYVATGEAQAMFAGSIGGSIALATDADTSGYSRIQKSAQAMVASAQRVAEFLDRDTDRGTGYRVGLALQDFLMHPDQDLDPFLRGIQATVDKGAG